jgi:hypothetical protein
MFVILTSLYQWSIFLLNTQTVRGYNTNWNMYICTACLYFLSEKLNVRQNPSVFGNARGTLQKVAVRYFSLFSFLAFFLSRIGL